MNQNSLTNNLFSYNLLFSPQFKYIKTYKLLYMFAIFIIIFLTFLKVHASFITHLFSMCSVCLYSCAYTNEFVLLCFMYRPVASDVFHKHFPPFETCFPLNLTSIYSARLEAGQALLFPCLCPPALGCQVEVNFSVSAWKLWSSPHACTGSTLGTELSPWNVFLT